MVDASLPLAIGRNSEMVSMVKIWQQADFLMLFLAWGMWAIACLIGWMMDSFMLALGVGGALAIVATLVRYLWPGRLITRLWFAFTLIAFSALLIQLGQGEVEYHFSIFVLLSALLAYRDFRPLLWALLPLPCTMHCSTIFRKTTSTASSVLRIPVSTWWCSTPFSWWHKPLS